MLYVLFYVVVFDYRFKMYKILYVYSVFNYIEFFFVIIELVLIFYIYCSI